jgi:hypothetical protein
MRAVFEGGVHIALGAEQEEREAKKAEGCAGHDAAGLEDELPDAGAGQQYVLQLGEAGFGSVRVCAGIVAGELREWGERCGIKRIKGVVEILEEVNGDHDKAADGEEYGSGKGVKHDVAG